MAIVKEMREGFARMESRFAHIEGRLDQIYNRIFLLSEEACYVNGANIHLSGARGI
jgi:hypothetical protein